MRPSDPLLLLALGAGSVMAALAVRSRPGASRILLGLLALSSFLGVAGILWACPILRLPAPTGPSAVGTTVVQWTDEEREETATTVAGDRRVVVAQLWYPAATTSGVRRATYLGRDEAEAEVVADGLASTFGVPPILLSGAQRGRTNAGWNAPVAGPGDGGERWPLVLFSPGLGGVRTQNSGWAEELASHGYVVVALDHPHDSAAVVLDDGTVVRSQVRSTGDRAEDDRLASEWTSARAADLRFVSQQLLERRSGDLPAGLRERLDPAAVAVTGHSLGGAAAVQAASEQPAFAAAVDIDGFPRNVTTRGPAAPVLFVVAGRGTGDAANDGEYERERHRVLEAADGGGYEVAVPGTAHLSFTDAPLFLPPLPALVGAGERTRGPTTTATLTRQFLDVVLRGANATRLEASLREHGKVRVWR